MVACIVQVGCSDSIIPDQSEHNYQDKISVLINEAYQDLHSACRNSFSEIKILGKTTRTYLVSDYVNDNTRQSDNENSFDIHTVSVDFGTSDGYVILSDTPGLERVFYYTENGSIEDSISIPPLKELIDSYPYTAANILAGEYDDQEKETRASSINIGPLVRFNWHQAYPFNNYATYCTCDKCKDRRNHMPIGCVTIAVGQTIATVKHFTGTFYGNRDIDFDSFPSDGLDFIFQSDIMAISHFLQEIALNCQIKFGCDGSGTSPQAATFYLRDLGYNADYVEGELNEERYIRYLNKGLPNIAFGINNKGGHAWILDGIKNTSGTDLYHINWGHGFSNGWSDKYYYTNIDGYITEYKKKHSHIYIEI